MIIIVMLSICVHSLSCIYFLILFLLLFLLSYFSHRPFGLVLSSTIFCSSSSSSSLYQRIIKVTEPQLIHTIFHSSSSLTGNTSTSHWEVCARWVRWIKDRCPCEQLQTTEAQKKLQVSWSTAWDTEICQITAHTHTHTRPGCISILLLRHRNIKNI